MKSRLGIVQVAEYYGIRLSRNGKALCPFHDDKKPSMSFKNGRFKCFACGAGGTVIDFASNLFGLSPLEAAKKLGVDFGLGLELGRPAAQTVRPVDDSRRLLAAFEIWEVRAFKTLCDYLSLLESNKKSFAPQTPADLDRPHPLFIEACHKADYVEQLIDILIFGSFEEKLKFFKSRRQEVKEIANDIKKRFNRKPA